MPFFIAFAGFCWPSSGVFLLVWCEVKLHKANFSRSTCGVTVKHRQLLLGVCIRSLKPSSFWETENLPVDGLHFSSKGLKPPPGLPKGPVFERCLAT